MASKKNQPDKKNRWVKLLLLSGGLNVLLVVFLTYTWVHRVSSHPLLCLETC